MSINYLSSENNTLTVRNLEAGFVLTIKDGNIINSNYKVSDLGSGSGSSTGTFSGEANTFSVNAMNTLYSTFMTNVSSISTFYQKTDFNISDYLTITNGNNMYVLKTELGDIIKSRIDLNNNILYSNFVDKNTFTTQSSSNQNTYVSKTEFSTKLNEYYSKTSVDALLQKFYNDLIDPTELQNKINEALQGLQPSYTKKEIDDKFTLYYPATLIESKFLSKTDATTQFYNKVESDSRFALNTSIVGKLNTSDYNNDKVNFLTKSEATSLYYTEQEIDAKISQVQSGQVSLAGYDTSYQVNDKLSALKTEYLLADSKLQVSIDDLQKNTLNKDVLRNYSTSVEMMNKINAINPEVTSVIRRGNNYFENQVNLSTNITKYTYSFSKSNLGLSYFNLKFRIIWNSSDIANTTNSFIEGSFINTVGITGNTNFVLNEFESNTKLLSSTTPLINLDVQVGVPDNEGLQICKLNLYIQVPNLVDNINGLCETKLFIPKAYGIDYDGFVMNPPEKLSLLPNNYNGEISRYTNLKFPNLSSNSIVYLDSNNNLNTLSPSHLKYTQSSGEIDITNFKCGSASFSTLNVNNIANNEFLVLDNGRLKSSNYNVNNMPIPTSVSLSLDSKLSLSGGTLTGTLQVPSLNISGLTAGKIIVSDINKNLASSLYDVTQLPISTATSTELNKKANVSDLQNTNNTVNSLSTSLQSKANTTDLQSGLLLKANASDVLLKTGGTVTGALGIGGTLNMPNITANQILISDGSKNVTSSGYNFSNLPISQPVQTELDKKAPLNSFNAVASMVNVFDTSKANTNGQVFTGDISVPNVILQNANINEICVTNDKKGIVSSGFNLNNFPISQPVQTALNNKADLSNINSLSTDIGVIKNTLSTKADSVDVYKIPEIDEKLTTIDNKINNITVTNIGTSGNIDTQIGNIGNQTNFESNTLNMNKSKTINIGKSLLENGAQVNQTTILGNVTIGTGNSNNRENHIINGNIITTNSSVYTMNSANSINLRTNEVTCTGNIGTENKVFTSMMNLLATTNLTAPNNVNGALRFSGTATTFIFPGPLNSGYYKVYIGNNFRGTTTTSRPRMYFEGVIDCFTETVHTILNINNALVVRFGNNTNTPTLGSIGLQISLSSAQLTALGGTTSSTTTGWINIIKLF